MALPVYRESITVPPGLYAKVMNRLATEQRARAVRYRITLITAGLVSLLGLAIPVWQIFQQDMAASGLTQYLSLMLTDSQVIRANWPDYTVGILEALPTVSMAMLLAVVLAFLWILRLLARHRLQLKLSA